MHDEKLVLVLFLQYGCFSPIGFPSYVRLLHMRNAWVFSSMSHSIEKGSKTHQTGKAWEIGSDTIPVVWVFFLHQTNILLYFSRYGKRICFLVNFPQHGKRQQNPSDEESLRNQFTYSFLSMSSISIRFPSSSIIYGKFTCEKVIWEMHVFSHLFVIYGK